MKIFITFLITKLELRLVNITTPVAITTHDRSLGFLSKKLFALVEGGDLGFLLTTEEKKP
jgi:hypothetical protein